MNNSGDSPLDMGRERLAAITESAEDAIVSKSLDGVIESWNPSAQRMFGYTAEEIIGQNVRRLIPPDRQDEEDHILARLRRGETLRHYESVRLHKDGTPVPVSLTISPIYDKDHHIIGASKILRDIGARLAAEAAFTADLQRFRLAMDATADAIMLVSRSSMRFIEVNATSCKMLGYTNAEILALGPLTLGVITQEALDQACNAAIAGQVGSELCEVVLRCKDGRLIQAEVSRQAMEFRSDWIIISVVRDVTERKLAQKRLLHQASHDALTGLPNREFFYDTLRKTVALATQQHWKVAVMFIDLDQFKNINDTLGHAVGDELLIHFSSRLMRCVRTRDTVGRLGGDEFGIILMFEHEQGAAMVAGKIHDALREPFVLQDREVVMTASIGITVHPDDGVDPESLIRYADTAMYQAKNAGRSTHRFFTPQMDIDMLERQSLESALRGAIQRKEFELYYQPKVSLASGAIVGVEALLRWNRPGHGVIGPVHFVPILEEAGMMVSVGNWVLRAACRQIRIWRLGEVGAMQISVNLTSRQFVDGDLEADVLSALSENQLPAGLLELELTESSLMVNTERTMNCLRNLRQHGVKISIDDFGTGYSSLAYLRRFPIDKLKIDIAFIRDVTSNPDDATIVLAIITMARSLHLEVIAEGVETTAQQAYLLRHHCDQIQGYLVGRPMPAESMTALILLRRTQNVMPTLATARQTLLIVDDDAFIRALLVDQLADEDYQLLVVESAAQAFETLAENEVQVILCDQKMPGMEGTVFLEKVKTIYPGIFRIILSGETSLEIMMEALNHGTVDRFYTKPWDFDSLVTSIRQAFLHQRISLPVAGAPAR